ncbi:hypothetical protein CHELA20_53734 [Hyphomicrobiales bacterium]|nr:hypothetical protein CHELA41_21192 [Hyphomicrobiales bacterium]CAH1684842.1 hypothetical protein CHELA20_53734 [Hyphomicrobiales bacterium]
MSRGCVVSRIVPVDRDAIAVFHLCLFKAATTISRVRTKPDSVGVSDSAAIRSGLVPVHKFSRALRIDVIQKASHIAFRAVAGVAVTAFPSSLYGIGFHGFIPDGSTVALTSDAGARCNRGSRPHQHRQDTSRHRKDGWPHQRCHRAAAQAARARGLRSGGGTRRR